MKPIKSTQALNILAVLEQAGRDLLIERTPLGWRVETEQRGAVEGLSCTGVSIADALGQLTCALALELELDVEDVPTRLELELPEPSDDDVDAPLELEGIDWLHDNLDDVDAPIALVLEPPVEFCTAFVVVEGDELAAVAS
jgi:hypothetical protein